jgi:pyruvate/2-oxoglutarate dehydrogenase complex dihydrolipoamide dehydrogenase (E3) component
MRNHDAIVIGTGQSGPALARRLIAAGQKVAVIERKYFGGTCVNTGCTPTKTLVASAYAAFLARRAGDYGVTIGGPVGVDMRAVKARKDAIAGASRQGVERSLKTLEGCTVYEGHARFVGDKRVAVNGIELGADRIFINVGGRASIPAIPGLDQVPYFTNSSMMDVDFHHPRRKLHRPRICAGLPPVRKRGNGGRGGTAPDRTGGRGCLPRRGRLPQRGRH